MKRTELNRLIKQEYKVNDEQISDLEFAADFTEVNNQINDNLTDHINNLNKALLAIYEPEIRNTIQTFIDYLVLVRKREKHYSKLE